MQLNDLVLEVRQHLPNLPEFIAERELRTAATEFFSRSKIWKVEHLLINTTEEYVFELDLEVPEGASLIQIESVEDGSNTLYRGAGATQSLAKGAKEYRVMNGNLEVGKKLTPGQSLRVVMALQNSRDSNNIPERFLQEFGDAFVYGAIARAAAYPERPWTSAGLVNWGTQRFETTVRRATATASTGQNTRVRVSKFQW